MDKPTSLNKIPFAGGMSPAPNPPFRERRWREIWDLGTHAHDNSQGLMAVLPDGTAALP